MAGAARASLPVRVVAAKPAAASTIPLVARARAASNGAPIPDAVRIPIEASFAADLRGVRVHQGPHAAAAAESVGARAFAFGSDIFLGARANPLDIELMAHEAAHVLQQQGKAVIQRAGDAPDACEREAADASAAVRGGESFTVSERTAEARVQRLGVMDFIEDRAWAALNSLVPELVPIIRKGPEGVFDWIKEKIAGAFEAMFDNLMAPVRAITGAGRWLSAQFAPLLAWMQDAAARIARNDCSPFREAAEKIEQVLTMLVTPIVEKIRAVADKVRGFLDGIWQKFGAPIWDWIRKFAGEQWAQVERVAAWAWDKTATIREMGATAWTWFKNKLGIGEGPEGRNGLLQWVQGKAEAAWNWVKERLEPYKKQLIAAAAVIGAIAVLLSPAGPVLVVAGLVVGAVQGVRWIKANWGKGNAILQARSYLEKTLIPALMGQLNRITAAVTRMAASLGAKLGELAAGASALVATVAGSILRAAVNAMQWIAEQAIELAQWGSEKLAALAQWIQATLARVIAFMQPMLEFLGELAKVVANVYFLPLMLAGKAWNLIPSCIRNPVVDFVGPLILRQIAIFEELAKDNEAWQKTKADVMNIIRLIFTNRDIKGAIKAAFHLVLRVFNVPLELLVVLARKAAAAWDAVVSKPIAFIKNAVLAVGHGFKLLWKNLWEHLRFGVEGWIFGELAEKGITAPKSWTSPMDLLGFVLDVAGLSMNHVFELLRKRFDKDKVDKLQAWYRRLAKVWQWVKEIIDTSKTPGEVTAGLIDKAKGFGKSILEGIVGWIVERVGTELSVMATAAAASAGISQVIDIARRIYKAILTAKRWMAKILGMVNEVLDSVLEIVAGAIEGAGAKLEAAMHRAMPIVISFLGDQVGLGGIGLKLREIVDALRAKVDEALLWLIDKIKAAIDALVSMVKSAAKAIFKWWTARVDFEDEDGASHRIFTKGEPPNVTIAVKSDEAGLDRLVDEIGKKKPSLKKKAGEQRDDVVKVMSELAALSKQGLVADNAEAAKAREDRERQFIDKSKELDTALTAMAATLVKAGVLDDSDPDESEFTGGPSGHPTKATAFITSKRKPGSAPESGDAFPRGWRYLMDTAQVHTAGRSGSENFVKMHLLNHKLGGQGDALNLTPGGNRPNGEMERWFEKPMKYLIGEEGGEKLRGAAKLNIKVQYRSARARTGTWKGVTYKCNESDFPERITGDFSYCFKPRKKGKFLPGGTLDLAIEPPIWD